MLKDIKKTSIMRRKIEDLYKKTKQFPEVKNSLDGIKRRFDKEEENISLRDMAIEAIQNETQREKRQKVTSEIRKYLELNKSENTTFVGCS